MRAAAPSGSHADRRIALQMSQPSDGSHQLSPPPRSSASSLATAATLREAAYTAAGQHSPHPLPGYRDGMALDGSPGSPGSLGFSTSPGSPGVS
eukprot:2012164-Pyramimonas_sp.AAC.1